MDPKGAIIGLSDSGWMDMHLFKQWLINHFICDANAARPLLLLLDGHSSHYNSKAVAFVQENGITLCLLLFRIQHMRHNHLILQFMGLSNPTGKVFVITIFSQILAEL